MPSTERAPSCRTSQSAEQSRAMSGSARILGLGAVSTGLLGFGELIFFFRAHMSACIDLLFALWRADKRLLRRIEVAGRSRIAFALIRGSLVHVSYSSIILNGIDQRSL